MAASGNVKIPPDWLHEPRFPQRSELLVARTLERRQVALDAERTREPRHHAGTRSFAHSDTIARDSFRKCGAFDFSGQPPLDPAQFHARATCSGAATRSALLSDRHAQRRAESLACEPHEVERLRDIPKAAQLREWWRQPRDGYVADPLVSGCNSLRLKLAHHGLALGPIDPGKVRSPASVDERRQLQARKTQLADKVPRIAHSIPAAYLKTDCTETTTITRAPDLYAQERQQSTTGGGGGGGGTSGGGALARSGSLPPAFPPVSPIRVSHSQPQPSRRVRPKSVTIESLFVESMHERAMLEQLKTCEPLASPSASDQQDAASGNGGGCGSPTQASRGVRCSGFV